MTTYICNRDITVYTLYVITNPFRLSGVEDLKLYRLLSKSIKCLVDIRLDDMYKKYISDDIPLSTYSSPFCPYYDLQNLYCMIRRNIKVDEYNSDELVLLYDFKDSKINLYINILSLGTYQKLTIFIKRYVSFFVDKDDAIHALEVSIYFKSYELFSWIYKYISSSTTSNLSLLILDRILNFNTSGRCKKCPFDALLRVVNSEELILLKDKLYEYVVELDHGVTICNIAVYDRRGCSCCQSPKTASYYKFIIYAYKSTHICDKLSPIIEAFYSDNPVDGCCCSYSV